MSMFTYNCDALTQIQRKLAKRMFSKMPSVIIKTNITNLQLMAIFANPITIEWNEQQELTTD